MSEADYLEAQRKAFEEQFGSLESMGFEDKTKQVDASSDDNSSQMENDGSKNEDSNVSENSENENVDDDELEESVSENENEEKNNNVLPKTKANSRPKPKVFKFDTNDDNDYIPISKKEQKLIRSGKTLKQLNDKLIRQQEMESKGKKDSPEDENAEQDNLQNDLELQRFLQESHLLNTFSQQTSGADLTLKTMDSVAYQDTEVMGKARMRTLEGRLNNISSLNKVKSAKLEKVPMNIRKGMINKHRERISTYEQEARDGGIILSKVKKGQFRKIDATYKKDIERRIGTSIKADDIERNQRRQRGLKIHSVGKSTRNGLIISKEDIARINNSGNNHTKKFKKNAGKGRGKSKRR